MTLSPVSEMAVYVFGLLVVSSLIVAMLAKIRPDKDFSELSARVRAWWIMSGVFFGALAFNDRVAIALFGCLSFWALKEYVTLLKTRPADHRALLWAFLSVPLQYYWIAIGWYGMFIIFIPVFIFLWLPARLVLVEDTEGFIISASEIQWGLLAFAFFYGPARARKRKSAQS